MNDPLVLVGVLFMAGGWAVLIGLVLAAGEHHER